MDLDVHLADLTPFTIAQQLPLYTPCLVHRIGVETIRDIIPVGFKPTAFTVSPTMLGTRGEARTLNPVRALVSKTSMYTIPSL